MEPTPFRDARVMWSFWVAGAFAAIGAVAPIAFTVGGHNRLTGVVIPFGVAAAALAANALTYHRGRPLAVALYFIAGMAIVYGILSMLAVPIRLAVVGTCAVSACPAGSEVALSSGESDGLTAATFSGVLAVFIGFYGLLVLYRRRTAAARQPATVWPAQPPAKTPEPAAAAPAIVATPVTEPPAETPEPAPAAPAVSATLASAALDPAAPPSKSRVKGRSKAARGVKLETMDEPKELPAPDELKELPPPG